MSERLSHNRGEEEKEEGDTSQCLVINGKRRGNTAGGELPATVDELVDVQAGKILARYSKSEGQRNWVRERLYD